MLAKVPWYKLLKGVLIGIPVSIIISIFIGLSIYTALPPVYPIAKFLFGDFFLVDIDEIRIPGKWVVIFDVKNLWKGWIGGSNKFLGQSWYLKKGELAKGNVVYMEDVELLRRYHYKKMGYEEVCEGE
eukprot:TRINITY_DN22961_c0_g1_i1.p1 TRINITY_DN22961_c0_g1~~TRINITY_DN22961_c0_g1_i1.p1  ORF type:complete len:128 (-),score=31.49 TRINITY_DN22961_c0_g1_i1:3-386(-)